MKQFPLIGGALWLAACAGAAQGQVLSAPAEMAAFQRDKAALVNNPDLDVIPNSLLVKFRANTPVAAVGAAMAGADARIARTYSLVPGLSHVRTAQPLARALAALRANPWVEYAEPDYVQRPTATTPNDQYYGLQYGLHNTGQSIRDVTGVADADMDGPEAWDIIRSAPDTVIAVLDTGVQWSHPDLAANIYVNSEEIAGNGVDDDGNGFVDDVRGWDFYQNDSNPDDSDGHGTHVAGTIGAVGNNGTGVAGVAWDIQIMPLRFLGPQGGSTSDAVAALDYAVMMGVKVSNNSWGGGGFSTTLYNAINNAAGMGHVFVAAAGNSGVNTDSSAHYPSAYNLANIISVAATDNRDRLASFSNYGVTTVDLGAAGVDIASTYSGSGYVYLSGTSMASPHVAGVVALLQAQNPGWSAAQVKDRIMTTTRPISALSGLTVTGGVVNAFAALNGGGGGGGDTNTVPQVNIGSPAGGAVFTQGDTVFFSGSASDTEDGDLTGSIVWTSSIDGPIGTGGSFSTSGLSAGSHTVTAAATDSGDLSASDTVSITVNAPAGDPPAAPSGLSATNNADRTATVSWSDNSDNESAFDIEREKQNRRGWSSPTLFSVGAGTTSIVDDSGTGTFRYRVRSRNASGESAWTAWAEVTVTRR